MVILDKEEYEKIRDNSQTGFETTTDKRLINVYDFPSPMESIMGKQYSDRTKEIERANLEMTRRLKKEIQRFNYNSSRQTNWIIKLTIAMLIVGITQIVLLIYSFFHSF